MKFKVTTQGRRKVFLSGVARQVGGGGIKIVKQKLAMSGVGHLSN